MDFTYTDAQRDLAGLTRRLAEGGRLTWTALAEAGVLAAALPRRAGGDGYGVLEQCAVLVELGRAAADVPYLPGMAAASALARFGDEAQVARWAQPAGRGELVLTATLAGTDALDVQPDGDGFRVSGTLTAVPAAPYADLILIPAERALLLVGPADTGVSIERQEVPGGPGAGLVQLHDARLAADRVLGPEATPWLIAHAAVGACAAQLGTTERALELAAEYTRTREQFGRPIGSFQAVTQRLADAYVDVEAIRLTMWQAAWRLSEGLPGIPELHTATFWAADAGHRVSHTAVHVHGGVGIDLSYPLHRYFLAATYLEFLLGGATAQLRHLGIALAAD